jgi:tRNA dimethylallyltransferase
MRKNSSRKPRILVIVGPTSSGKSDLAVKLAKQLNGEVVSADSRQVYRGLNLGTGKITKKEMGGVAHYLLDVADPKKQFSVAKYKVLAEKAIDKIIAKGKLPIICGGTGFYIQAVVDGIIPPPVPPNRKLRRRLVNKSASELFKMLKKLDPKRAATIDRKNPRRLIRAIEIAKSLGKVPPTKPVHKYQTIQIGIKIPDVELKKRIKKRLNDRLKKGMLTEAKRLHRKDLSWKRMEELGLDYKYMAQYLQNKIPKPEMIEKIATENWRYAKRQRRWFKRDRRIKWIEAGAGGIEPSTAVLETAVIPLN